MLPSGFDEDNPLWIGAWWKGCVIVGVFLLIVSPLLTLFPGEIPIPGRIKSPEDAAKENESEGHTFRDFLDEN